jgi:hypothetical protein
VFDDLEPEPASFGECLPVGEAAGGSDGSEAAGGGDESEAAGGGDGSETDVEASVAAGAGEAMGLGAIGSDPPPLELLAVVPVPAVDPLGPALPSAAPAGEAAPEPELPPPALPLPALEVPGLAPPPTVGVTPEWPIPPKGNPPRPGSTSGNPLSGPVRSPPP